MTVGEWIPLFLVCATGAMSPGPSLALVIQNSVKGGFRGGALTAVSHGFGIGIYAYITVLGLGGVIANSPLIFSGIQWLGVGFLLYLSWHAWHSQAESKAQEDTPSAPLNPIRSGFLLAILNPKIAVFFLALFSQFIHESATKSDQIVMASTACLVDIGWYLIIAFTLTRGGLVDFMKAHKRHIDRASAIVMTAVALSLIYGQLK